MNHVFVKGSVLGIEEQDIREELVIPLSRPLKNLDNDQGYATNSMSYNSVGPSQIPKRSFLNPSAVNMNILKNLSFQPDNELNEEREKFNNTGDMSQFTSKHSMDSDLVGSIFSDTKWVNY